MLVQFIPHLRVGHKVYMGRVQDALAVKAIEENLHFVKWATRIDGSRVSVVIASKHS